MVGRRRLALPLVSYYCRYVTIYKVCTGEGRGVLDSLERMYKYPVARGAAVFSVVAPTVIASIQEPSSRGA